MSAAASASAAKRPRIGSADDDHNACERVWRCGDLLRAVASFADINERWVLMPRVCRAWRASVPSPLRPRDAPPTAPMLVITDLLGASRDAVAMLARSFPRLRLVVLIVWSSEPPRAFGSAGGISQELHSRNSTQMFLGESERNPALFINRGVQFLVIVPPSYDYRLVGGAQNWLGNHPGVHVHYRPRGHVDHWPSVFLV